MAKAINVSFTWTGVDLVSAILRQVPEIGSRERIMIGAMKKAAKPVIRQARQNYKAPRRSGSLAQAVTAYRWKRDIKPKLGKFAVHIGPKRSNFTALRRWIAYYRRPVRPGTFTYGIRHAHLYEWGFRRNGRKVFTGTRALERAGRSSGRLVGPEMSKIIGAEVQKEVNRANRIRTKRRVP